MGLIRRAIYFLVSLALSLVTTSFVFASHVPIAAPQPPEAPSPPVTPDKPNFDIADPQNPLFRIHGHVHFPKPNHRTFQAVVCNPSTSDPTNYLLADWHLPSQVRYKVNPSVPSSIASNLSTIVANSFAPWSTAVSGAVTFVNGGTTSKARASNDGENIVAWGRVSYPNALGVTYIWYRVSDGLVVNVDTIMNKRVSWSWTNPSTIDPDSTCGNLTTYDAQDILTHEVGHWVGLDDMYETVVKDSTMYGYGQKGELKKDTLSSGDIQGAKAVYGL